MNILGLISQLIGIKPLRLTDHTTCLLPGASLGPQIKDHTIRLLPGASLGLQVKDLTTWFLSGASLGP